MGTIKQQICGKCNNNQKSIENHIFGKGFFVCLGTKKACNGQLNYEIGTQKPVIVKE